MPRHFWMDQDLEIFCAWNAWKFTCVTLQYFKYFRYIYVFYVVSIMCLKRVYTCNLFVFLRTIVILDTPKGISPDCGMLVNVWQTYHLHHARSMQILLLISCPVRQPPHHRQQHQLVLKCLAQVQLLARPRPVRRMLSWHCTAILPLLQLLGHTACQQLVCNLCSV